MVYADLPRIGSSKRSRRKRRLLAISLWRKESFEFTYLDEEELTLASGKGWVKYTGKQGPNGDFPLLRHIPPVSVAGIVARSYMWLTEAQVFRVFLHLDSVTESTIGGGREYTGSITLGSETFSIAFTSLGEYISIQRTLPDALETLFATSAARTFFGQVGLDQENGFVLNAQVAVVHVSDAVQDLSGDDLTFDAFFSKDSAGYISQLTESGILKATSRLGVVLWNPSLAAYQVFRETSTVPVLTGAMADSYAFLKRSLNKTWITRLRTFFTFLQ